MNAPPPSPLDCGSTRFNTSCVAIAASMAEPPARSISRPASAASPFAADPMGRLDVASSCVSDPVEASGWLRGSSNCASAPAANAISKMCAARWRNLRGSMGTGRGGELFTNFRHHAAEHNGRWKEHCMASRRAFIWPLTGALLGVALLVVSAERGMTRDSVLSLLGTTQTIFGRPIAYPTEGPAKVAASIVTMQPGEETGWHRHDVPMFCYILEGEVTVDYGTKGTRVYKKGDALMEAIDWEHNGRNSGLGPVRILAVFMGAEGVPDTEMLPKPPPQ